MCNNVKNVVARFLYIIFKFTNTSNMIFLVYTIIAVVLTIPISIRIRVLASLWDKKIFYSIKLYKYIKINTGFLDFTDNRIVVRYGNRKAKPIFYKDMLIDEQKTEIIKHVDLIKCSSAILLGGEEDFDKLTISALVDTVSAIIYSILKTYKPYTLFKNDTVMLEQDDKSGFIVEAIVVTNCISLFEILTKKIYKGVFNLCQRINQKIKLKN